VVVILEESFFPRGGLQSLTNLGFPDIPSGFRSSLNVLQKEATYADLDCYDCGKSA
jgi:hypothetical protein